MGNQRYLDLAREALRRRIDNPSEQYKYITCDAVSASDCEKSELSERSPHQPIAAGADRRVTARSTTRGRWRAEVRKRWPRRAIEAGIERAHRHTNWPNEWGRSQAEVIDAYLDLLVAWAEPASDGGGVMAEEAVP